MTARPDDLVLAPEPAPRLSSRLRWPIGIIIVAVLRVIDAVTVLAKGTVLAELPVEGLPPLASSPVLTQGLDLFLAGATLLGIVGLLAFKPWGWVLTMVLVGVGLVGELIRVASGIPDYLGLLLLVISAFYLNQRSVRAMAGRHLLELDDAAP
jgi:hypothetical protein